MRKIYFAAPLHDESDRHRNDIYVKILREHGFQVYLPQEHGLWEDFDDPQKAREYIYKLDMDAMVQCDCCICIIGDKMSQRAPSEGAIWEMGWCKGANKTVILFNDGGYWKWNLMPEFGASLYATEWRDVISFLEKQDY